MKMNATTNSNRYHYFWGVAGVLKLEPVKSKKSPASEHSAEPSPKPKYLGHVSEPYESVAKKLNV